MKNELTAETLRALLIYEPETGLFRWRNGIGCKFKPGDVAGSPTEGGYVRIRIKGVAYKAHRLAWLYVHGKWPDIQVDHRNRIRSDNRIANLRDVTAMDNRFNQASPFAIRERGIRYMPAQWEASVEIDGRKEVLGTYATLDDAREARDAALAQKELMAA